LVSKLACPDALDCNAGRFGSRPLDQHASAGQQFYSFVREMKGKRGCESGKRLGAQASSSVRGMANDMGLLVARDPCQWGSGPDSMSMPIPTYPRKRR
jgi:hypothetical protein